MPADHSEADELARREAAEDDELDRRTSVEIEELARREAAEDDEFLRRTAAEAAEMARGAAALETLGAEMKAEVQREFAKDRKENRRRSNILLAGVVAILLVAIGVGVIAGFSLTISNKNRRVLQGIESISEKLEECTTPGPRPTTPTDPTTGHDCFDQAQARTRQAIAAIIDALTANGTEP